METLGKISYELIIIAFALFLKSFVIQKLWLWILVPVFGISSITMGASIGLTVIIGFLNSKKTENDEDYTIERRSKVLVWVFVNSVFYLLIGWIASLFI